MNANNDRLRVAVLAVAVVTAGLWPVEAARAQSSPEELEWRIQKLEKYVETFQPTITELSNNLNASINEYTQKLEQSLEDYSGKLQRNLDARLKGINQNTVVLNPYSQSFRSIETNTGIFLISIRKVEAIEGGVRLYVNIGNPNYADYQDFQLKFIWGSQWGGELAQSYADWRESLTGAEYTFEGKLKKGKWNSVTVDLTPTNGSAIAYLECEMSVSSVELGFD